ncbi:MAG: primosomal protein N' [Clostridiales bacterium]|nr:primosomal protein N' [Clostridiales bacterium]
MYADVIVDISSPNLDRAFTYEIPQHLEKSITQGSPVLIPFGSGNKLRKGYVTALYDEKPRVSFEIKQIDSVVKQGLSIEDEFMELAYRMKSYYGGLFKDSLRTVIPVKKSVNKNRAKVKVDPFPEISEIKKQYPEGIGSRLVLNDEQRLAAETICNNIGSGKSKTFLLHGVTGSGKTEVYIEAIKRTIERGYQTIVLIPEISLTYQTVRRFVLSFGERVAFSHSKLSQGERYIQSENAKNGMIDIMIGPRSALFTPFKKLGLIIIDEEHEASYKSESTPKYHAREVAEWRAGMTNATLLLGSATPSVESYKKALDGEYELLKLTKRAGNASLPSASIVDMREEMKKGNKSVFSASLAMKIDERLKKKEQIMLFLNRRGYAGFVACRSCGHVPKCPHCDISLTLHSDGGLHCHYCGYVEAKTKNCNKCGSPYYAGFGSGTQKIEDLIKKRWPQARVLRMDADTTRTKGSFERILSDFRQERADILIGTQMIVKGHDFAKVTLVGILAADLSMYAGDFRAGERTYQLIAQALGRAGRSELPGEAVIQTYNPEQFCIQAAAKGDYEAFYHQENMYRQLLGYPPNSNMCVIFIQSEKDEAAKQASVKIKYAVNTYCVKTGEKFAITGPAAANIKKLNDIYRYVIYVKHKDYDKLVGLKDSLEYFIDNLNINDATVQFDFNPMNSY